MASCAAYLDDIVAYSADFQSHANTFQRVNVTSLSLNQNVSLPQQPITYLSKLVGQVCPTDVQFPIPTTKQELCGLTQAFNALKSPPL